MRIQKRKIHSDEVSEGDMLPSIRQLAADLKISVVTTTRAYSDLEQEGFIVNVQGKGCFVSPQNSELVREQLIQKIEDSFLAAINAVKIAKLSPEKLLRILELMMEGKQYE